MYTENRYFSASGKMLSRLISKYALLIALFILIQSTVSLFFSVAEILFSPILAQMQDEYNTISMLVAYFLSLIIPFGLYSSLSQKHFFHTWSFEGKIKKESVLSSFGVISLGMLISLLTGIVFLYFGIETESSFMPESPAGIFIYILMSVILAPILEEIVFRGIILKEAVVFGRKNAVFLSAFLFAVSHFSYQSFLPIFVIGFMLASMALKTNSLKLCIFTHALNNLLAVIMTYTPFYGIVIVTIIVMGIACGIYYLADRTKTEREKLNFKMLIYPGMIFLYILFAVVQIW